MAGRKPTGQVVERYTAHGRSFALRFTAYGQRQYVTLGSEAEGWTRRRAERELRHMLVDVERGDWTPAPGTLAPFGAPSEPTFHEFASRWLAARRGELRETTVADYTWQHSNHLLPFFHAHLLSEITVAEVDRYRETKVREAVLSAESINKTIARLGQILAVAEECDLLTRNPVRVNPRNRRLKVHRPRPVYLDSAEQITALLDAAADLDARTSGRQALVATLVFAGLRLGEACGLRWRDIDLAGGRLFVGQSKTDAGVRHVNLLPILRDELAVRKLSMPWSNPEDLAFPTERGTPRDKDNARERVIRPVVARADELLAERGELPLPAGVTAHKLRHTFASLLVASGEDPAYVMTQLGHTDPAFTLRVYGHAMRRDEGARDRLKTLLEGPIPAQKALVPF